MKDYSDMAWHLENEPEARAEILRASGFEVTEPLEGLCIATIDLADWDAPGDPG